MDVGSPGFAAAPVPEPRYAVLVGLGLMALLFFRRRRARA
ncbi:MAG: PEP-CTERM sorting domain-containing protein [Chthoniobacterales bacterium]